MMRMQWLMMVGWMRTRKRSEDETDTVEDDEAGEKEVPLIAIGQ